MVDAIGGFSAVNYAAMAGLNRSSAKSENSLENAEPTKPDAAETFMKYMEKSPAERMVENWLKAHKLDEEKLKAMEPEEREAIMKQMREEIADQLKRQTEKKGEFVDVTA